VFEFLTRRMPGDEDPGADIDLLARPGSTVVPGSDPAVDIVVSETPRPSRRHGPNIGLVLGGGAARGFAHIGVLRTLLANGIQPDIITGTSIGAVVGGCYAAGHLDAFDQWARKLTRRRIFGYLDFSLAGSGLITGVRLAEALRTAIGNVPFEDLPLRFAAIATEIGTGHEIWLTRGRVADALRASYALPGVFSPVSIGGRWLMDGALVNPVPVSAARALGARVVIAINLNADLVGRGATISSHGSDDNDDALLLAMQQQRGLRSLFSSEQALKRQFFGVAGRPGFSTVMMEAFNIMQDRITRARLAGDPPDVTISPRLGGVGLIDFHRATEAIELGAEATERALGSISEAIAALR
jgi:NTE family protein